MTDLLLLAERTRRRDLADVLRDNNLGPSNISHQSKAALLEIVRNHAQSHGEQIATALRARSTMEGLS